MGPYPAPTRRDLLAAGASAAVAATVAGAAPARAAQRTRVKISASGSDRTCLSRLLRVELLMVFAYHRVLGSSILRPHAQAALAPLRANEEAHVRVLSATLAALGGTAPAPPASVAAADKDLAGRKVRGRLGQLKGQRDALGLLLALERVVVGAYYVALLKLESPPLITLAAQIMANDAQHEALIGEVLYHGNAQRAVPYGLVQGVQ
jgi:hypothetical protein